MRKIKTHRYLVKLSLCMLLMTVALIMASKVQAAVTSGEYSVRIYNQKRGLIRTDKVKKGELYTIPSRKNTAKQTFLGWSKGVLKKEVDYVAGERIRISGNLKLYAVMYNKNAEIEKEWGSLPKLDQTKYKKIIFVGDSRTNIAGKRFRMDKSTKGMDEVKFIGRNGGGLSWLKSTAYKELLSIVKECNKEDPDKQIAIVFNLGVNDLYHGVRYTGLTDCIDEYVSYMNKIAVTLGKMNCRLFYMSLNPVNCLMDKNRCRDAAEIYKFNYYLRKRLSRKYKWIDCSSYLTYKGYVYDSGIYTETGKDDGLHYTTATYQKIYRYCILKVNKS